MEPDILQVYTHVRQPGDKSPEDYCAGKFSACGLYVNTPPRRYRLYGNSPDMSVDEVRKNFNQFTDATRRRVMYFREDGLPLMSVVIRLSEHTIRVEVDLQPRADDKADGAMSVHVAFTGSERWRRGAFSWTMYEFPPNGPVVVGTMLGMSLRADLAALIAQTVYAELSKNAYCYKSPVRHTLGENNWRKDVFRDTVKVMVISGISHLALKRST